MDNVISLRNFRERNETEKHARALVLFECAADLARREHLGLLKLVEQIYGSDWVEDRVRATVSPRRVDNAPRHVRGTRPAR